jgi:hypothetical protein
MSGENRSYGQMVQFLNAFVGAHTPALQYTVSSVTPEKTLVADQDEVQLFIDSLRPQPPGRRETLTEFIMFQLAKPKRSYAWLAAQFCDQLPGVVVSSELPDSTFSVFQDDQEVETFMRSLRCHDAAGAQRRLDSDCEAGSADWFQVKIVIKAILRSDQMQYNSESI